MSDRKSLLIELGTEELPVTALPGLAQAFFEGVVGGLEKRGIALARAGARALYTPRRLAVLVPEVALRQADATDEQLGPPASAGWDAGGAPTPALLGFAQRCGIEPSAVQTRQTPKGERLFAQVFRPGAATATLLPAIVGEALAGMPIPKPMRWGAHEIAFARPVHWLVMLLGDAVVDGEILGVRADRMSRGHRFMHGKPLWIGSADEYVECLRSGCVLVDPDERRARIVAEVEAAAASVGGRARIAEDNLAQVNCLVEWPSAVLCGFEPEFLEVPAEALVLTMETNQKFFPVLDAEGRMSRHFVGVANIESTDVAEVRKGYERVIRPRFADARFFFDEDRKQGLASMNAGLAGVTYQQKLGSHADKVARVAALAETLAPAAGVDPALARRAAELSKADLQSRMVGEFPELQGIAGRVYAAGDAALADLPEAQRAGLALALDEVYMPRNAADAVAASPLGRLLAVAERLDTLAGGFAAGLKPTGNKDPFALRRNALGLARTIVEGGLELDLPQALHAAAAAQPCGEADAIAAELYDFVLDRLRGYYAERGVPATHFEAVIQTRPASLGDLDRRLDAIAEFARLPEAEALAAANKRIANILRKAEDAVPAAIDRALLSEPAEQALAESVEAAIRETDEALATRDYVAVLRRLAWLRAPVDSFFDDVMVMAEDAAVRGNRLALLQRLRDRFGAVADVAQLSG
ncbi:glycine--tRNA ligase subunit beta [Coralloluteibacterium thermophilus]|uniref:Glycine--tRNA ligase beta subunit n=1 Tax=Coralloluteibacterium thermophilum TaxID=2707049 RepID=A0ABV9NK80_9GAMM